MRVLLHLALIILLAIAVVAQETTTSDTRPSPNTGTVGSAASAPQPDETRTTVAIPPEISGIGSLSTGASEQRANLITGGVIFGSIFDDNVLNLSTSPVSDVQYTLSPRFGISVLKPRTSWKFDYAGGVAINQRIGASNVVTHDLSGSFVHSPRRHVVISTHEIYKVSSNPFSDTPFLDQANGSAPAPQTSPVLPTVTTTKAGVDANIIWQTGPNSVIAVTGGASRLRFDDNNNTLSSVPTNKYDGRAFYGRKLRRHTTVGVMTGFQDFVFPAQHATTRAIAIQYVQIFELSKAFTLLVFGGPQHSSSRYPTIPGGAMDQWFPSGGFSLTWVLSRFTADLSFTETVNDSGGLTQAVRQKGGGVNVRTALARTWILQMGGGITAGNGLVTTSTPPNDFRTVSARAALTHQLREGLSTTLGYEYAHQAQHGLDALNPVFNRNRVQIGMSYQFVRPWGR